jgi:hypothetical protein
MILTVHRWFANKSCPGNWLYAGWQAGHGGHKAARRISDTVFKGSRHHSFKDLSDADVM